MGGADSDGSKTTAAVKQGSPLAAVLAYNIVAILYAGFASYTGTTAWFDGTAALVGTTLHDRFYAYSAPYASIARATIAYELYNTAAVLLIHEYRNFAFIFHHSTCLVLGIMSTHPFCHYYATFFFGLTAISSIPLSAIELFQAPTARLGGGCRAIFYVVFIIFRTLYWPDRVIQVLGRRPRRPQRRHPRAQRRGALLPPLCQRGPHPPAVVLDVAHLQRHRRSCGGGAGPTPRRSERCAAAAAGWRAVCASVAGRVPLRSELEAQSMVHVIVCTRACVLHVLLFAACVWAGGTVAYLCACTWRACVCVWRWAYWGLSLCVFWGLWRDDGMDHNM